ncbi:MAG: hypothetical protein LC624_02090 [Halobacteriales archaeon]|nr:hypothetical protein [Halobacteriales archaeon]
MEPMPQKYVNDIVAPAIVDTLILGRALNGIVQVPDVERIIQSWGELSDNVEVRERCEELERSGHLRREGTGYRVTDDGRQDVQKVLPWFRSIPQQIQATPGTTTR